MLLLLLCARPVPLPDLRTDVQALLEAGLDWDSLLALARPHRMLPLLHSNLQGLPPETVPSHVRDSLTTHFLANTRKNLYLTGQLLHLIDILEAKGIPTIAFKGPVLAASTYGNVALREFVDVDILVHVEHIPHAIEVLQAQEYQPDLILTESQETAYLRYGWARHFERLGDGVAVDLHWKIAHKSFLPLDVDRFWRRSALVPLGGRQIRSLHRDDVLLMLALHGGKHRWESLEWIGGLARLLHRNDEIDWNNILGEAERIGGRRMLFLGLLLARDLLGATLPEDILSQARRDRVANTLGHEVQERLLQGGIPISTATDSLQIFDLKVRERPLDRVRYCFHQIMTPSPEEWALVPLPKVISPLYYGLRPLRLASKYSRLAWKTNRLRSILPK